MPPSLPRLLPVLLAAVIAGTLFLFGYHVYPIPSGDSQSFLPTALSMDAGHGLRNPVSDFSRHLDPSGRSLFIQYPPLFPLTVALLMPVPGPRSAFLVLALLGALSLALAVPLLWRALGSFTTEKPIAAALAVAVAVLGLGTLLLGQQNGRPEALAMLWVLLAAHALRLREPQAVWLPCGLLLGLAGATHPMGGVILGLLLAAYLSVRLPARSALLATGKLLALSLAVFLTVLALGPVGIAETLDGIRRHAALTVVDRHSQEHLATYWITNPGATFYALPFLLLVPAALRGLRSWRSTVRSPLLLSLCLILLAAGIWNSTVRSPEHAYNLLLFAPLVFAANLRWAFGDAGGAARVLVPAVHGLAALGFLRALVLFGFFLNQGVSLDAARAGFARLAPTARGPVSVTPSLWVLSDDLERLRTVPAAAAADTGRLEGDLLVVQQNYSGLAEPPVLPGLQLIEDRFVRHPCLLFGLPVARTTPGYAYAVYRKASLPS